MAIRRNLLAALLAGLASAAAAQTAPPAPAQPAAPLPRTGHLRAEMDPSLFVLNARGAMLEGTTLTLEGIAPVAIVFADRPVRAAGHVLTRHLIAEWDSGQDSFGRDPPNATISVIAADGTAARDAVVVLKAPKLEGDRLVFTVQVLEGSLAGATGPASVFIDGLWWHWHPFGFGLARRATRQAFWYDRRAYPPPGAYPPPPYAPGYAPPAYPPYPYRY